MRLLAAAVGLIAALALASDARRAGGPVRLVAKAPIALRVAPNGGAPVRATLEAGEDFEVKVRQGNWALIRSQEKWGWTIEAEESAEGAGR